MGTRPTGTGLVCTILILSGYCMCVHFYQKIMSNYCCILLLQVKGHPSHPSHLPTPHHADHLAPKED